MKRALTAAVLIPVVVGLIFLGSNRSVRVALALAALLCLNEFFKLAEHYGARPMRLVGYVAAAWIVAETPQGAVVGARVVSLEPGAPFFLGVTLLLLTLAMLGGRDLSASLTSASATLLGIVYAAVPFRLAGDLHGRGPQWLFYILLINWIGDTAAYYAGRAFGRHKLAPRISPGKTWEGAVASLLFSVPLATLYVTHHLPHSPPGLFVLELSVAANIAAQIGDLAESALKRGASVKDSGGLLPGHGGMLDRVDGLLFSIPVVWLAAGM